MPDLKICGSTISFPYEPYPCQKDYMEKVVRALTIGANAILESPTGTGKTLCLLCAALGWQKTQLKNEFMFNLEKDISTEKNAEIRPKFQIYYLSRTHSQLQQVVKELKKTSYNPKMTVLGSREHLCINEKVKKAESGLTRNNLCRVAVKKRNCIFHANRNLNNSVSLPMAFDIEEAESACRACGVCPYFHVRDLAESSNLILMPYNYLIDKRNRTANQIQLKGSIVIIDEAHNIDRVCQDCLSTELSLSDLLFCINIMDKIMDLVRRHVSEPFDSQKDDGDTKTQIPREDEILLLKKNLISLENKFRGFKNSTKDTVLSQQDAVQLLNNTGFGVEAIEFLPSFLNLLIEFLASKDELDNKATVTLTKLSDFIIFILNSSRFADLSNIKYFRLCVSSSLTKDKGLIIKMSFWCFSPYISIKTILDEGPQSLIFTSGTLCPSTFEAEIKLSQSIRLENSHIITGEQVKLFSLAKGFDDSTTLSSKLENRSNYNYSTCLGRTIIEIIKRIPGGILVFFPSYHALKAAFDHWKSSKLLDELKKIKRIFVETSEGENFRSDCKAYMASASKGSIFIAVCRGKMSEGFDFADDYARAVIIVGLPYPSKEDNHIKLKIDVLNEIENSGQLWYQKQAMVAVNQAIGRVIRHRDDYGLIFLLDVRFSAQGTCNNLSKWMRPFLKNILNFNMLIKEINEFFSSKNLSNAEPVASLLPLKRPDSTSTLSDHIIDFYKLQKPSLLVSKSSSETVFDRFKNSHDQPSKLIYQSRSYDTNIKPFSSIKVKDAGPRDLSAVQLVCELQKKFDSEDFKTFSNAFNEYRENHNIFRFMELLDPILSLELFQKIDNVIRREHKAVFFAFMENYQRPNLVEKILIEKPKPAYHCSKCSRAAPYELPCKHLACSRCYAESAHSGKKCIICKKRYNLDEVLDTFCSDD